jgi:tRNA threonylcarbamoyladenosine biosynthesis protein TsaB
MRILAIETSGHGGALAALEGVDFGTQLLREVRLEGGRTAQVLAPTLEKLLADVGWPPRAVELVAVATGPGSFTGLRIGVTTAKTFAYAAGAQMQAVDTLDVLAAQAPRANAKLWTIMDAQRQELFIARFALRDGHTAREMETHILSQAAWVESLQTGERVTGPAIEKLRTPLPQDVIALPEPYWQPRAEGVGMVAWREYQSGKRDDLWQVVPNYFRLSAAEEKRAARG